MWLSTPSSTSFKIFLLSHNPLWFYVLHTYINTCIHTHIYKQIHAYTYIHSLILIHSYTLTCIYAYIHMNTHTHTERESQNVVFTCQKEIYILNLAYCPQHNDSWFHQFPTNVIIYLSVCVNKSPLLYMYHIFFICLAPYLFWACCLVWFLSIVAATAIGTSLQALLW